MVEYFVLFSVIFLGELCILEFYLEFFNPKKSFLYFFVKKIERFTKSYLFVEKFLDIKK